METERESNGEWHPAVIENTPPGVTIVWRMTCRCVIAL